MYSTIQLSCYDLNFNLKMTIKENNSENFTFKSIIHIVFIKEMTRSLMFYIMKVKLFFFKLYSI